MQLQGLIQLLKKTAHEQDVRLWKRIASDLERPTRQRRIVNLHKLNKVAQDNESIIVPGKVLGDGVLTKKVSIAAFSFSDSALEKIKAANAEAITIPEMLKKNPKGQKLRIIG